MWLSLAYCARYGHQPLSELFRLTLTELAEFHSAVSTIVEMENKK